MARYIVTSGSFFDPFSYDELAKPLEQATEAHNETADAYDQMSMEAMALEEYLKNEPDKSRAKQMYDTYMGQLTSLQNELWNNGYSAAARRNLSAARAGYASNITRLQKAITTRQERSKEYWKNKHADDSLVASSDPGKESLDKYLEDDNYGSNWYQYSGKQFMTEVGTDAQAYVKSLRDRAAGVDPSLYGYLTERIEKGFSPIQVNDATNAVFDAVINGNNEGLSRLDVGSTILANILMNHIQSSGAVGRLDRDEMIRFIKYGAHGLSQSVGETSFSHMQDLQEAFMRDLALKAQKNSGSDGGGRTYEWSNGMIDVGNDKGTAKVMDKLAEIYEDPYKDKPDGISILDDTKMLRTFKDIQEATDYLYNTPGRGDMLRKYGIDIAFDKDSMFDNNTGQTSTLTDDNGNKITIRLFRKPKSTNGGYGGKDAPEYDYFVGIRDKGRWVTPDSDSSDVQRQAKKITDEIVTAKQNYDERMGRLRLYNGSDFDPAKIALSPETERKLKKTYNIPNEVPVSEYRSYINTKHMLGVYPIATLTSKENNEKLTSRIASTIFNQAARNPATGKTSEYAFYKINRDGTVSDEGRTNILDILGAGDTKKGRKFDPGLLSAVDFKPEEVAKGKIRIINANGDTYLTSAKLLGDINNRYISDLINVVETFLRPITDPDFAYTASSEEIKEWKDAVDKGGKMFQMTGIGTVPHPRDIVVNRDMQQRWYNSIVNLIGLTLSGPRADIGQNNFQSTSDTSTKGGQYLETEE